MPGWKNDLIDLADYAYLRLRSRLEGISDDEYFWEPAPGCWTVRRTETGEFSGDWHQPVWPAPLTTIAWRVTHVINNLFDPRYATHLGLPAAAPPPHTPGTATEALAALEAGFATTRSYLDALSDESLTETLGSIAGPWQHDDRGSFVLHMLDELIHHAAEIGVLRDLYRAKLPPNPIIDLLLAGDREAVAAAPDREALVDRARSEHADLLVQAAAQQRWPAVPLLMDRGFPLAMPDGTSALHHAAAGGDVETVNRLLEAGAGLQLRDSLYRATPQEWATFFIQQEAADLLESAAR